jgi:hypothetical protein
MRISVRLMGVLGVADLPEPSQHLLLNFSMGMGVPLSTLPK